MPEATVSSPVSDAKCWLEITGSSPNVMD